MGNIHTLISDTEAEMLRHFPLPLCVLTLEEDSGNARLLIASDAACEFFGRDHVVAATLNSRIENGLPELHIPSLDDAVLGAVERIHIVACGTAMPKTVLSAGAAGSSISQTAIGRPGSS